MGGPVEPARASKARRIDINTRSGDTPATRKRRWVAMMVTLAEENSK
jgi:hypothetical protein